MTAYWYIYEEVLIKQEQTNINEAGKEERKGRFWLDFRQISLEVEEKGI